MNRSMIKRVCMVALIIILTLSHCLPVFALDLQDLLTEKGRKPVRIEISSPEIHKLEGLDEKRTSQINLLIRHFLLGLTVDGSISETSFFIDDECVYSKLIQEEQGEILESYSFQTGTVYKHKNDLSNRNGTILFADDTFIRLNSMADIMYRFFSDAPSVFSDYSKEEKTSINYKGYGNAVRRVTVTIPENVVVKEFPGLLARYAENITCRKFFESLIFSGRQRFILLFDQNHILIRVSYDGIVGTDESDLRKASLVWKCARSETLSRDSFLLKTPSLKGYNRYNIEYSRELDTTDTEHQQYYWEIQIDRKADQDRARIRFTADFETVDTSVSGQMEYSETQDHQTTRIIILPQFLKENEEEYKGTLEIESYSGKILKNSITLHASVRTDNTSIRKQVNRDSTIDVETVEGSAEEEKLQDQLIQLIVQRILRLPDTDIVFLSDGIPVGIWDQILSTINRGGE